MELSPLFLSFEVATIATLVAAIVGVAVAGVLANARFAGRDVLEVIATAPLILPPTVLGYYLLVLLGRSSAIGRAYEALTGSSIVFTKTGAVVAATVGGLPFVVRQSRAAFESVDPTLLDAARSLGATPLRAFCTIQCPLAVRGIAAGLVLAFARALGDFGVTLMLAGNIPGQTRTASLAIYDAIQSRHEGDAWANVIVLTVVALTLLYGVGKGTRRSAAP